MPSKAKQLTTRDALKTAVIDYAHATIALEQARINREDAMLAASLDGVTQSEIAEISGVYQPKVSVLVGRARERAES